MVSKLALSGKSRRANPSEQHCSVGLGFSIHNAGWPELEMPIQLSLNIQLPKPVTVYSLVLGGWFPLSLTGARIHVLDRNVLIWLRSQTEGAKVQPAFEANRWWLDFLNRSDQTINPILCAFEGRDARLPTYAEFLDEYRNACGVVSQHLPTAQLIRHNDEAFPSLFEVVSRLGKRFAHESEFLCAVAPLLVDRRSGKGLAIATDLVLDEAASRGVADSLSLLAVLSSLYEGPGETQVVAAKKILKPTRHYSTKRAHNALADLKSLELFAAGLPLSSTVIGLCTRDRALAAFWCQLGIRLSTWSEGSCKITYSPSPKMFPVLPPSQIAKLLDRLAEGGFLGQGTQKTAT